MWDCYRIGIDPALFYVSDADARYDDETAKRLLTAMLESTNNARSLSEVRDGNGRKQYIEQLLDKDARRRELIQSEIRKQFPTSRYGQTLGRKALAELATTYQSSLPFDNAMPQIEDGIATLSHLSVASDGTTKLLIRLRDGMEVESVIIQWYENNYSTLCISSQVGCRQACRFCATGRMGLLRTLTAEEILAQYFWATKICRLSKSLLLADWNNAGNDGSADPDSDLTSLQSLPDITNLVFMGMGEPADAEQSVNAALDILTDVELYHLSPSKVTVSTVAPSPDAFAAFAESPCVLAWSVHAANDELRRQLVPTTRHTMEELRQGLVEALKKKPAKLRDTVMLEVALIDNLNDGIKQADELADLALKIVDDLPNAKVLVNLIPFNDIGHPTYRKPSDERVRAFQERLWERGVFVHVRSTRGDDESAACGQLATKKKRERIQS